ncbi:probable LRR receptor-like serine/threonine-protein kinase At1g34110 [Tripterygium wilfordii]|uniref:probable LRR receptor-like serine/threonine-protein kinase At1g34110 n=1 Tax=Tripterygium wilfordii TaxID=458696 RepID=UPI0018F8392F|nr:probable LRR receptor-like serine/threonine-protein kinase At1g34110 [Tripterygium wilfordii]
MLLPCKPFYKTCQQALFLLVIVLLSSFQFLASTPSTTSFTSGRTNEPQALLKWKASLSKHSQSFLPSWVIANGTCHWEGIACSKSGSIVGLDLSSHGLRGTLHSLNFSSLPNLLTLKLGNNSLSGTIPSNISNLSKLTTLILWYNKLSGNIPSEIGLLNSLRVF